MRLVVGVLWCASLGIGCGGGNAPSFNRDAGSKDAVAGSKLLRDLNAEENIALCQETIAYLESRPLSAADTCRAAGFQAAQYQFFSGGSDAQLQAACVQAYAICLMAHPDGGSPVGFDAFPICSSVSPSCPATVDQLLACVRDLVTFTRERQRDLPLCHQTTAAAIQGFLADAGAGPVRPATCERLLFPCFGLM